MVWLTLHSSRFGGVAQNIAAILCAEVFLLCQVLDDASASAASEQDQQLGLKYTGSVENASCTVRSDSEAIRSEIGSQMQEVNRSVQVLLESGMSTVSLRRAAACNVHMEHAGRARTAFFAFICSGSVYNAVNGFYFPVEHVFWTSFIIEAVVVAVALVGVYRFPLDQRATFLRTLQKFSPLYLFLVLLYWVQATGNGLGGTTDLATIATIVLRFKLACLCMSLAAGVAGPGRVAELPCIGPWLLSPEICHCPRRAKLSQLNLPNVDADAKAMGEIVETSLHHQISKTSADRAEEEPARA
jgi:hypothetical protein